MALHEPGAGDLCAVREGRPDRVAVDLPPALGELRLQPTSKISSRGIAANEGPTSLNLCDALAVLACSPPKGSDDLVLISPVSQTPERSPNLGQRVSDTLSDDQYARHRCEDVIGLLERLQPFA